MPWPPVVPTGIRTNTTPNVDIHADDHNKFIAALNDIVTQVNPGAWTNFALLNGATAYGGGFATPSYRKIGDIVYLRGLVNLNNVSWPSGQTFALLPAGFRPPAMKRFIVSGLITGASTIDVGIPLSLHSDGNISPTNATKSYIFLDGVVFSVT